MEVVAEAFWVHLAALERKFAEAPGLPAIIEQYAARFDDADPAWAFFCRSSSDPAFVRTRLMMIRRRAETDGVGMAIMSLRQLEQRGELVWSLATQAALSTGTKQREYLQRTRDKANAERSESGRAKASAWQLAADHVWQQRPCLSKNAVATIIRERVGASETVKWIASKIEKPPTAG